MEGAPSKENPPLSCTFNLKVRLERSFNHEELFIFMEVRFFLLSQSPSAHESALSVGQEKVIHQGLSVFVAGLVVGNVGSAALAGTLSVPVMSQSWARLAHPVVSSSRGQDQVCSTWGHLEPVPDSSPDFLLAECRHFS